MDSDSDGNSNQHGDPALSVIVTSLDTVESSPKYKWEVTMRALDSKGKHQLGYRASGLLTDLHNLSPDFPIQVHDKDRPVWTTMNPGDRKDIRERIRGLVLCATKAMSDCGHD